MQQNFSSIIIPLLLLPPLLAALWRLRIRVIKRYHSPQLGKVEVAEKYNREKLLTINNYAQGVSINDESIKKSYWYLVSNNIVWFCQNKKDPKILMLGLGANTIPNIIAKLDPRIHLTLIEFDRYIIQACREFFDLDRLPNYQLILGDAYELFNPLTPPLGKFDVIIVDIFTGKPPYVSLKSNKPNFIEKLLPSLKRDGMIIFNRPGNTKDARSDSQKLKDYLSTLFNETKIHDIKDPRGYRNNVVIGFKPKLPSKSQYSSQSSINKI